MVGAVGQWGALCPTLVRSFGKDSRNASCTRRGQATTSGANYVQRSEGRAKGQATIEEHDFEALHRAACAAGELTYVDPDTGLVALTKLAHRRREKCCGSSCRHCPYAHFAVKPGSFPISDKARALGTAIAPRVVDPVLLRAPGRRQKHEDTELNVFLWVGGSNLPRALWEKGQGQHLSAPALEPVDLDRGCSLQRAVQAFLKESSGSDQPAMPRAKLEEDAAALNSVQGGMLRRRFVLLTVFCVETGQLLDFDEAAQNFTKLSLPAVRHDLAMDGEGSDIAAHLIVTSAPQTIHMAMQHAQHIGLDIVLAPVAAIIDNTVADGGETDVQTSRSKSTYIADEGLSALKACGLWPVRLFVGDSCYAVPGDGLEQTL